MLWLPIPVNGATAVLSSGLVFLIPLPVAQTPSYGLQWIALIIGRAWVLR
jgi:hypothetical protein